jgi:hypothetical protein
MLSKTFWKVIYKINFIFSDLASRSSKVDQQRQDEQRLSNDQPRKTVRTFLEQIMRFEQIMRTFFEQIIFKNLSLHISLKNILAKSFLGKYHFAFCFFVLCLKCKNGLRDIR